MTATVEPQPAADGGRRPWSLASAVLRVSLSNLAIPASAFATGPILARTLGPAGRGELAAVLAPLALVTALFSFGLPEALTYVVATRRASVASAARIGVIVGALSGVIALVVILLVLPTLLHRYPHAHGLLTTLALTLPVLMGVGALRAVAQGRQRFDLVIRERWFSVVVRLALICAFAAAGTLTVSKAAWATHGVAVAATIMLIPITRERRARDLSSAPSRLAPYVVRYGARTWFGTLSTLLILRLDQALLVPFAGARQLGFYAVAVSIAEVPATALLAVRDVVFATSADRSDPALVARAARLVVLVAVPVSVVGILVAPFFLPAIFGRDFGPSVAMTQILFLAAIPGGVTGVLGAGLLSAGRPGLGSLSQAVAAVVTVVALVLLVPPLGAIGAAYASLLAYAVAAALVTLALARVTGLRALDCLVPRPSDARYLLGRLRRRLRAADQAESHSE